MNILVTGAKGQLGRSLEKTAPRYPLHRLILTDVPEGDITDPACMQSLVKQHAVGLIVNCAAYTAVDKAETDAALAEKINAEGPRILAGIARQEGIGLIHVSTDYVFNGEHCHPLHEEDPTGPTGVYGRTKLSGEEAIRESGCEAVIIRTSWLYSEFGNNFLKTMLRLGRENAQLTVVYDQVGTPTYAPDLAEAILYLADRGIAGSELYHFSNEGVTSWYDFAWAIFDLSGMPVEVNAVESDRYPTAAKRPAYSVLSKDKIRSSGVPVPYWRDSLKVCLGALTLRG